MFYVKIPVRTGEMPIQLTSENVYTKCPECGKEHIVDLEKLVKEKKGLNLRTTRVSCPECSLDNKELLALFRKKTAQKGKTL